MDRNLALELEACIWIPGASSDSQMITLHELSDWCPQILDDDVAHQVEIHPAAGGASENQPKPPRLHTAQLVHLFGA